MPLAQHQDDPMLDFTEVPAYRLRAGRGPLRVDARDVELLSGHARLDGVGA